MTSYHQTDKGVWTRCRAVKRKGAGVSLCPLEAIGVRSEHRNGMEGIAASGGGVLRRWIAEDTYRETKITPNGDGTFEAATGKRKRVFKMDGTLIGLKERVKAEKAAGNVLGMTDHQPPVTKWKRPESVKPRFFVELFEGYDKDGKMTWSRYAAKSRLGELELELRGETGRIDPQGTDFYDIPAALSVLGDPEFNMEQWESSDDRKLLERYYPNALLAIEDEWEIIDALESHRYDESVEPEPVKVTSFFGVKKDPITTEGGD